MTEQERFERFKANDLGCSYDQLKSFGDTQEEILGFRYQKGSNMAKDWTAWIAAAQQKEGYVLVPVEPTPRMLESVGTMEGWDGNAGEADENHIDWYQAMISAAQEAE